MINLNNQRRVLLNKLGGSPMINKKIEQKRTGERKTSQPQPQQKSAIKPKGCGSCRRNKKA